MRELLVDKAFSIQPLIVLQSYLCCMCSVTRFLCPIGPCLADCAGFYPRARRVSCGGRHPSAGVEILIYVLIRVVVQTGSHGCWGFIFYLVHSEALFHEL